MWEPEPGAMALTAPVARAGPCPSSACPTNLPPPPRSSWKRPPDPAGAPCSESSCGPQQVLPRSCPHWKPPAAPARPSPRPLETPEPSPHRCASSNPTDPRTGPGPAHPCPALPRAPTAPCARPSPAHPCPALPLYRPWPRTSLSCSPSAPAGPGAPQSPQAATARPPGGPSRCGSNSCTGTRSLPAAARRPRRSGAGTGPRRAQPPPRWPRGPT